MGLTTEQKVLLMDGKSIRFGSGQDLQISYRDGLIHVSASQGDTIRVSFNEAHLLIEALRYTLAVLEVQSLIDEWKGLR